MWAVYLERERRLWLNTWSAYVECVPLCSCADPCPSHANTADALPVQGACVISQLCLVVTYVRTYGKVVDCLIAQLLCLRICQSWTGGSSAFSC